MHSGEVPDHVGKKGGVEESFSRRFVIFISIVAQKLLQVVNKPLVWAGSAIEFLPNFLDANGGFLKLLFNFISGKLDLPNKESQEFLSVIGLGDIRRDLDKTIKHRDLRYTSALAIMAAKSAYENPAYIKQTVEKHWKMEFLGFFNCWNDYEEDYTTQRFMWSDKTGESELIDASFRGTSPFNTKGWSSDVDLSWQKLKDRLQNNPNAKFLITGHSLGAALAIVFPTVLAHHNETDLQSKLEGVYTFGQPRVRDHKFGKYMKEVLVTHGTRYHSPNPKTNVSSDGAQYVSPNPKTNVSSDGAQHAAVTNYGGEVVYAGSNASLGAGNALHDGVNDPLTISMNENVVNLGINESCTGLVVIASNNELTLDCGTNTHGTFR
ncbi:triacylglycerol lipase-like 1 [Artemisia annua]|uniref:Triacylglycerol lipase-like 1 n=1 Tax=Artemisia annua TaxID=35608 RepID=A0A2U1M5T4_ARTAN|nr:triacylglycerol lipase-like 1 [Artemisia annua]